VAFLRARPSGLDVDTTPVTRVERFESFVTASGEIVADRFADIGSAVMGRLVDLPVKEGDRVKAGQVLARIDPVQAASGADAATAALGALEADARAAATQVAAAKAAEDEARTRHEVASRNLTRARDLQQAGLMPQADFDRAKADADAAAAQLASATATARRAIDTQEAAVRRIAQGRAETTRARDQLAKTEITSPIDGVITRLDLEEGEMVVIGVQNQPGTILMTVSDLSAINAEVKVAEADVMRIRTGNTATVTFEAIPGGRYQGHVVDIGASALPQTGTQAAAREFRVRVRLDQSDPSLRPGLTCDAEILVATRERVLTVPLQAVVERNGRTGVFVVDGGLARFTPVTTGIIGGLMIEVDGVAEGVEIVSGPFQALRSLQDSSPVR
jgi:HlyD family secretion protein